jgi:hypothetical protein
MKRTLLATPLGQVEVIVQRSTDGHIAVRLTSLTLAPVAVISVALPGARYRLRGREFFASMWGSNALLRASLLATELFQDTGIREGTGNMSAEVWRLTALFPDISFTPLRRAA